jgi:hypothetical protein
MRLCGPGGEQAMSNNKPPAKAVASNISSTDPAQIAEADLFTQKHFSSINNNLMRYNLLQLVL